MFVPRRISAWAERTVPRPVLHRLKALYTVYHHRTVCRLNARWLQQLIDAHPATVQTGPFKGMRYGDAGLGSESVAKWLGAYEMELHEIVERCCTTPYVTVINIGCAEGYYTVGLARRLPEAKLYAFDLNPTAAAQCRRLTTLNDVAPRVTVAGRCDLPRLQQLILGRTLIVCDCEGAELELLDPAQAPRLAGADLLVELHDFLDPTISPTLVNRLAPSHTLSRLRSQPRDPARFPRLSRLRPKDQALALDEFRPGPMEWLWAQAK